MREAEISELVNKNEQLVSKTSNLEKHNSELRDRIASQDSLYQE